MSKTSEKYIHITLVRTRYRILKRGRKWFQAEHCPPGHRPVVDKVEINSFSTAWEDGQVVEVYAVHHDTISPYGHDVKIIPISKEDYLAAPSSIRYDYLR